MLNAINEGTPVTDEVVEKFRPTSGRITGVIALGLVLAVTLIGVLDQEHGFPPVVVWGALFVGSLVWAAMLRPRMWATTSDLVMRNMVSTVFLPLAAIEQIAVRQVVAVRVGEQRFVSPAVGRTWRQTIRPGRSKSDDKQAKPTAQPYPNFVDDRLHQLAEEARAKHGIALLSDEQLALADGVRREWSWLEIALIAGTFSGFVLTFVV